MIVMGINYNHLRYFWAVAHAESLTRAAGQLNVSQSALSVQLQKLEAQLGHALFERRGRGLVLTEAGRIALDHADAIFKTGEELLTVLKGRGAPAQNVLRVGALATLSRNFQMDFVAPLLGRRDVELVLRSGNLGILLQELEALRLDVVLLTAPPARDSATPWVAHPLAEQPISLVGTRALAGAGGPLTRLLDGAPVVLPTPDSAVRTRFDALVDRLGVRPHIAAEVDDMAMMRLLARAGAGLTVVSPIVVKDEIASGRLVEAARLPDLAETFYALTPQRRFPNPLLPDLIGRYREGQTLGTPPVDAGTPPSVA